MPSNAEIIEQFRANGGIVGGPFEGATLLVLHTTGAKTGRERVTPLMYQPLDGGAVAVFASKGGAPTHPDWYHNLRAHPDARIEIGTEHRRVRARVAGPDERAVIWERQKQRWPGFADYERRSTRVIPVVILEPVD